MQLVLILLAGFGAGFINALAGGGSFLTFPALIAAGLPAIDANASSTIALFPAQVATTYAYRDGLKESLADPRINGRLLAIISLVGGLAGALLLLATPESLFERSIPFLLGGATLVFAFGMVMPKDMEKQLLGPIGILVVQVFVSIYGGYFGGGIGILMLAMLEMIHFEDIHAMNGLKTVLATAINGAAVVTFILARQVEWPQAILMIVGAVAGGYYGAHYAQKLDPRWVRATVIGVGAGMSVYFLWKY